MTVDELSIAAPGARSAVAIALLRVAQLVDWGRRQERRRALAMGLGASSPNRKYPIACCAS